MRALKIILAFWLLGMLAIWIREGRGFCVAEAMPFVQRERPFSGEYELQAVLAVLIGVWGVCMLARQSPPKNVQASGQGRFRSEVILVPMVIIVLAAISQRITAGRTFSELIGHTPRAIEHTYLAVFCVAIYAVVLAFKFFRNQK